MADKEAAFVSSNSNKSWKPYGGGWKPYLAGQEKGDALRNKGWKPYNKQQKPDNRWSQKKQWGRR